MRVLLFAPFAVLLLGCETTPRDAARLEADQARTEAKLATALSGLTPGQPQDCLPNTRNASTERYGDTILYRFSRTLIYRNDTSGGCYGLDRGDTIVTSTPSSQLCSGDIAHTVDLRGAGESGSCSLGKFVPYRAN